jgi:hypothetical protein
MTAAKPKKLVALTSFACEVKGVEYVVRTGDELDANHPVVKGREDLFGPAKKDDA